MTQRDDVSALRKTELDVASVLRAYVWHADMIAGDIDALAVLDDAALVYAADDAVGIDLLDNNGNQTVVKQQLSADCGAALVEEDVDELRVGNRNSVKIALIALLVECEIRAFLKGRLSVGEGSDSDLGSLGVKKDSDVHGSSGKRPPGPRGCRATY